MVKGDEKGVYEFWFGYIYTELYYDIVGIAELRGMGRLVKYGIVIMGYLNRNKIRLYSILWYL